MAQAKSIHFTGVIFDGGTYRAIEGWFEGRTKMRMRTKGASEEIQDGDLRVRIRLDETPVVVHYSRLDSRDAEHTDAEMFAGPDMLQEALTKGGHLTSTAKEVTLPGGRAGLLLEVVSEAERSLITVEAKTYRLISLERHNADWKLRVKIDHVEYDTDFPDSVFQPTLPPGAIVEDDRSAPAGDPEGPL